MENIVEYLQLSNSSGFVGQKIGEQWITTSSTYAPTVGTKRIKVTITGGGGAFNGGLLVTTSPGLAERPGQLE
ncbi:TPA: hypothetical protein ACF7ZB_000901 [Kluyvera georgiana]